MDDAAIVHACKDLFRTQMNHSPEAWDALGVDYHQRLEKNYVVWVRRYLKPSVLDRSYDEEELSRRPIAWSIGGFSQVWTRIGDLQVAQRANIKVEILKCRHFPQLEIPQVLASHIREHAKQQVGRERVASQRSV